MDLCRCVCVFCACARVSVRTRVHLMVWCHSLVKSDTIPPVIPYHTLFPDCVLSVEVASTCGVGGPSVFESHLTCVLLELLWCRWGFPSSLSYLWVGVHIFSRLILALPTERDFSFRGGGVGVAIIWPQLQIINVPIQNQLKGLELVINTLLAHGQFVLFSLYRIRKHLLPDLD